MDGIGTGLVCLLATIATVVVSNYTGCGLKAALPSRLEAVCITASMGRAARPGVRKEISSRMHGEFRHSKRLGMIRGNRSSVVLRAALLSCSLRSITCSQGGPETAEHCGTRVGYGIYTCRAGAGGLVIRAVIAKSSAFPTADSPVATHHGTLGSITHSLTGRMISSMMKT